jgi:hypothetical protein
MLEPKIISFPRSSSRGPPPPEQEPGLFGIMAEGRGRIAFLDVGSLTEDTLLSVLVRNAVVALIDLRPLPIFRAPRFQHKRVVSFLIHHNIRYVEAALVELNARKDPGIPLGSALGPIIQNNLSLGLTICLFDEGTREKGWLEAVRLATLQSCTELHPRSLVGSKG